MGNKSKKKRSVFTSRQKFLMIIAAFVILLTIIAIALNPTGKKKTVENNPVETEKSDTLKSVQDVIEYYDSIYYSSEISSEEGYDLDIKVSFKYNLYEGDESKEIFFKNIYEKVAYVTGKKSFRIIDEDKDIIIAVKCTSNGIYEIKINGETDYFRKEDSKRSAKKNFRAAVLNLSIDSPELRNLIESNWSTDNIDLGSKEGSYYKYDIYFDEGYEIRNIQGKVYNIVFTKKYNGTVVDGFKVGTSLEKIEANLGKTYEENGLLGYKTNNFYVWFSDDEISIYPIRRNDYSEFEELAKEYNEKKDANDFMYKITDVWTDYDLYDYNENYVRIVYANKGVSFEYSIENPVGIKLYENYTGELRDNIDDYKNIFYSFDKNLTGERELERRETKTFYDDGDPEEDPVHYSPKFQVLLTRHNDQMSKVKIKSIDGKYPNNEFDEMITITGYVWIDESNLIYGVSGEGVFLYNAETRETEQLIFGEDAYKIIDYDKETTTLTYDDKSVKINF